MTEPEPTKKLDWQTIYRIAVLILLLLIASNTARVASAIRDGLVRVKVDNLPTR